MKYKTKLGNQTANMRDIDSEIEKIVNRSYKDTPSEDEGINFVIDRSRGSKISEHISFKGDDRKITVNDQYRTDHGHMCGNKARDTALSRDIFSCKPFETPERQLDGTSHMNLVDLLGLDGSGGRDSRPKVSTPSAYSGSNTSRAEEINQFIEDLFSSRSLEEKIIEHQKQGFGESMFRDTSTAGYRQSGGMESLKHQQDTTQKHTGISRMGRLDLNGSDYPVSRYNRYNHGGTAGQHPSSAIQRREGDLYTAPKLRQISTPDCLLFRNPVMHHLGHNPRAYSKIKRRRRASSSAWCSSGGMLTVHPSKLSSLEFVHGGMNLMHVASQTGRTLISPKTGTENGSVVERFKSHIDKLDFDNITVHELKNIMKDYGLNSNGKKKEMIERLKNTVKELGRRGGDGNSQAQIVNTMKEEPHYDKYFF